MWKNAGRPWGSRAGASTGGVEEIGGFSTGPGREENCPQGGVHISTKSGGKRGADRRAYS